LTTHITRLALSLQIGFELGLNWVWFYDFIVHAFRQSFAALRESSAAFKIAVFRLETHFGVFQEDFRHRLTRIYTDLLAKQTHFVAAHAAEWQIKFTSCQSKCEMAYNKFHIADNEFNKHYMMFYISYNKFHKPYIK